jgi:ribosomally synthesized peptide (two-chain TOMM family)
MPAFGGLVLRAIALAWTDPDFKEALLYPPGGDASSVLSQWLGYNSPFNFKIKFVTNPGLHWDGKKWNLDDADGQPIKNRIVLNYPVAPKEQALQPIALTSYNNTGPAYPFTC